MNLIRKIKNCKRHKQNKELKDRAKTIQWLAMIDFEHHNSDRVFIVNPLMYEIIRCYYPVPDNLRCSGSIKDVTEFIMTVGEFWNNNKLDYIKEWCGIPKGCDIPFASEPLYFHVDKPIAPDINALNGVRV